MSGFDLSISSILSMDEHRQLLTELEVMAEENGNETEEGQDSMSEDAASTRIEWDDWSSATYGQSMKDEVLADALRMANTDLVVEIRNFETGITGKDKGKEEN